LSFGPRVCGSCSAEAVVVGDVSFVASGTGETRSGGRLSRDAADFVLSFTSLSPFGACLAAPVFLDLGVDGVGGVPSTGTWIKGGELDEDVMFARSEDRGSVLLRKFEDCGGSEREEYLFSKITNFIFLIQFVMYLHKFVVWCAIL